MPKNPRGRSNRARGLYALISARGKAIGRKKKSSLTSHNSIEKRPNDETSLFTNKTANKNHKQYEKKALRGKRNSSLSNFEEKFVFDNKYLDKNVAEALDYDYKVPQRLPNNYSKLKRALMSSRMGKLMNLKTNQTGNNNKITGNTYEPDVHDKALATLHLFNLYLSNKADNLQLSEQQRQLINDFKSKTLEDQQFEMKRLYQLGLSV